MELAGLTIDTLDAARDEVARRGYTVIRGLGETEDVLRALLNAVGHPRGGTFWSELQTVRYRPGTSTRTSVAESDQQLPAHTDGSFETRPPELLFLQCVRPDRPGHGESRVITVDALLAALPPDVVEVLRRPEFRFRRRDDGRTAEATAAIIWTSERGYQAIRYRHDDKYRIEAGTAEGTDAVARLADLVQDPRVRQPVALGTGDVLWLDNRRCLHARTALSGTVTRELRTGWADWQQGRATR